MSTPENVAKSLLDQIAVAAGKRVEELILDLREQINEAITATIEDAVDEGHKTKEGKRAVLTIPASIKWDLDTRAVQVSLAVAIKHKASKDIVFDDPNQKNLPLTVVDEDDAEETESDKAALASILRDRDGDAMPDVGARVMRRLAKAVRDAGATVTAATNPEGGR